MLAFINAVVSMLLFMLAFKGLLSLEIVPSVFHAYSVIYLLFTPAFLGFILTTFPRFSSTPAVPQALYLKIFGLFLTGSLLFEIGVLFSPLIFGTGMLLLFTGHAWAVKLLWDMYHTSAMDDKHDLFRILTAMVLGVISHLFFIIGVWVFPLLLPVAIQTAIYLYLFLVGFSVAQRMVLFFSHCMVEKDVTLLKKITLLLAVHVLLEIIHPHLSFIADFALAYLVAKELLRWKLPFPNPNPLLWILHISLFWIPVAFLFAAMSNLTALLSDENFLFLDIHILMLGFLFTILIGFGTRVTIGHSGNMMQADKWTVFLFSWTQVVVIVRLITSMAAAWGWNFMVWFDISATVWLLMFILWGSRFFGVLIFGRKL